MSKKKRFYVDNEKFFNNIVEFRKLCSKADNAGQVMPQIPEIIAKDIMLIAEHLSFSPKFVNYTFKEDLILDGIENCILAFNNFDPEKGNKPFSYFTMIIYYAFLRRIQKEKKQLYIKHKVLEEFSIHMQDNVEESEKIQPSDSEYMKDFVQKFEDNMEKKKKEKANKKK